MKKEDFSDYQSNLFAEGIIKAYRNVVNTTSPELFSHYIDELEKALTNGTKYGNVSQETIEYYNGDMTVAAKELIDCFFAIDATYKDGEHEMLHSVRILNPDEVNMYSLKETLTENAWGYFSLSLSLLKLRIGGVEGAVNMTLIKLQCFLLALNLRHEEKLKRPYKNTQTYLMTDGNTGYTKIGRSYDPHKRETTLQSEKPTKSLLAISEDNCENELHEKYAKKRIRGEWFNLSEKDIKTIIKQYSFKKLTRKVR